MLYAWYRYWRYSPEENEIYYKIRSKHEKIHAKSIFFGAVPVLVAATISQAFSAIITAIVGDNNTAEVLFYFIYSLTMAQAIGYYVIYWLPTTIPSYQYYYRIATKHCAFAWKSCLVVVLIDNSLDQVGPGLAFGYWCCWLLFLCSIIAVSSLLQVRFTRVVETLSRAKRFEAEIFALGLSYTLDLIVISGICDVEFISILTGADDDVSITYSKDIWYCYNTSIIYPLVVTSLLTALHSMGLFDKASAALEVPDKSKVERDRENAEYEEMQRMSVADLRIRASTRGRLTFAPSGEDTSGDGSADTVGTDNQSASTATSGNSRSNSLGTVGSLISLKVTDESYSQMGMSIKKVMTPVDAALCFWDEKRTVNLAISMMFVVMFGFFCGSSWYSWSILSFQFLLHKAYILSATIFAVVISAVVWNYLVMVTYKFEYDEMTRSIERITTARRKRNQLLTLAGRLIVGWSWSEVLVEIISVLLSKSEDTPSYAWKLATVRSCVALAVFVAGRQLDLWLGMYQKQETETIRATFAAMDMSPDDFDLTDLDIEGLKVHGGAAGLGGSVEEDTSDDQGIVLNTLPNSNSNSN